MNTQISICNACYNYTDRHQTDTKRDLLFSAIACTIQPADSDNATFTQHDQDTTIEGK